MYFYSLLKTYFNLYLKAFFIVYCFIYKHSVKLNNTKQTLFCKLKFYKGIFIYDYIKNDFLTMFFNIYFFFVLSYKKKKASFNFSLKKKNDLSIDNEHAVDTLNNNKDINFFLFFIKFIIIAIALLLLFFVFTTILEVMHFTKILSFWGSLGFLGYILISGFNYFTKRYGYNKYTEALQRFWKRSFSIFWLLEGFIFFAFIFLTFNSSNEIIYGYDPQFFFKLHLFSWRIFIFKLVYNLWIIFLVWFLHNKNKKDVTDIFILKIISIIIIYIFYIEFCQFFHFLNHSNFSIWTFTFENNEISLESDFRKSRTVNNYVLICAVAKFWHVIFIFFTWFFFFNKFFESNSSSEYMLATNLQNFLILYLLNLISMYPWIKNIFRFYFNDNFFWFFLDFKNFFFEDFFFEAYLLYSNLF